MTQPPPSEPPDLRQRILRVALEAFAERGYSSTSMRLVAERAGCTKPALYYHFGSKEDLFRAVFEQCRTGPEARLEQALECATSTRDRLQRFAQVLFEAVANDPMPMNLVLSLQARPDQAQPAVDMAAFHHRGVQRVVEMLRPGIDAGEIRDDVDLAEAAELVLTAVHARIYLATKGIPVPADSPRRIVDLLFEGLAPRR
ncbi:MAG: TetR/AcrR family transcriptional regulator [Alphaproteobacteria bacterium]|nr:TetR/AcrR family transcriptional regulator [Alphaproteobacteria bacterium]